jgi:hypothetical protein
MASRRRRPESATRRAASVSARASIALWRARALITASTPAIVTIEQRTMWSALKKKSFHVPLATASVTDSAAARPTVRGRATSASASGGAR